MGAADRKTTIVQLLPYTYLTIAMVRCIMLFPTFEWVLHLCWILYKYIRFLRILFTLVVNES